MKLVLMRAGLALPIVGGLIAVVSLMATGGTQQRWPYWVVVVVCLILLSIQTWANFARQWYEPTLALRYVDHFFGEAFEKQGAAACRNFLKNKEWGIEIEDI